MPIRVDYQDGRLEFEGDADRLVAAWDGPPSPPLADLRGAIVDALEAPIDYPPLRQVIVPGDRLIIPIDRAMPDVATVLAAVAAIAREVGVESITAIYDGRVPGPSLPAVEGVELVVHDPSDRESLAYLANTEAGRRIYLNRLVADADCVVPIGRLSHGAGDKFLGPWSVIEPGLADTEARRESLLDASKSVDLALAEASEVSWLLGSQFQIAGIPGREGLLHLVAGESRSVQERGRKMLDEAWTFAPDDRADLVIAGAGGPGRPLDALEFANAFRTALRLVRRGGRIALLSRVGIETLREIARSPGHLRDDWEKALAWADLYLLSDADPDVIDELGIIPLDKAEQAAKLAKASASYLTVSQADRTRAIVRGSIGFEEA